MCRDIEEYQSTNYELTREKEYLESEVETLLEELRTANRQIDELNGKLARQEPIPDYRGERENYEELERAYVELSDLVESLRESNGALLDELSDEEESNNALRNLSADLQDELDEMREIQAETVKRAEKAEKALAWAKLELEVQTDQAKGQTGAHLQYRERAEKAERDNRNNVAQLKEITELVGGTWFSGGLATEYVRNLVDDAKTAYADVRRFRELYFEADDERAELRRKLAGVEAAADLQATIDHYRERAEEAEERAKRGYDEAMSWLNAAHEADERIYELEARASSWFEAAKTYCRAHKYEMELHIATGERADWLTAELLDRAEQAEAELEELKAALRTLGGDRD